MGDGIAIAVIVAAGIMAYPLGMIAYQLSRLNGRLENVHVHWHTDGAA